MGERLGVFSLSELEVVPEMPCFSFSRPLVSLLRPVSADSVSLFCPSSVILEVPTTVSHFSSSLPELSPTRIERLLPTFSSFDSLASDIIPMFESLTTVCDDLAK